ncbi:MAG: hypothetical protein ACF8AM_17915 [Rhodopirellula sp. JB055]|uniref:hypothetical protein n=1 Tax=Rhodopirellula sp. JB055 TaxID=3342846 RepID=UPI00370C68CB
MMNKTFLMTLLSASLAFATTGCDVEQTREGELPTMDVDVEGDSGKLPEFDVDPPEVDVRMEEQTIKTPDVDVDLPADD